MHGSLKFQSAIPGRSFEEGKKINWRDGFLALYCIFKFSLSDTIYHRDIYGSHILARLSRASNFNTWMADTIRSYCGSRILEIGSGVGNLTRKLIPRAKYVASDINPLYIQTLEALSSDRPYMGASYCDVTQIASFPRHDEAYDTVICLNVIEHVEDDRVALANIKSVLAPGGTAIVLVPQGQWNFGTLDEVLGHQRRYSKESLRELVEECGFAIKEMIEFNRVGRPPGSSTVRSYTGAGSVYSRSGCSTCSRRFFAASTDCCLSRV